MVKFSNPRLRAEIQDYPLGGSKRGLCVFQLEQHPKRGWRFTRTTTGKPKTATYGREGAVVDGDNGRTYLIQRADSFNFINVWGSDFKNVIDAPSVFPESNPELYAELDALIDLAQS
jgi:hypothetical protein